MAQKGQLTTADYLAIEDFKRLLVGLHNDKKYLWELYCFTSFITALRVSDVLSLKWNEILHKTELNKSEKKTGKTRQISINNENNAKITELYILLGKPELSFPIICNPKTQKPYSREHINRELKKFIIDYDLPKSISFSTHTFRKTFGRYVYDSMENKTEALVLLNHTFKHSNDKTTAIYIGLRQTEINLVFDSIKI